MARSNLVRWSGAVALGMAPAVALAQTAIDPYAPAAYEEPAVQRSGRAAVPSGYGVGVALGGGVSDFTEGGARTFLGRGAAWNLRLTLGTRLGSGLELAYVGGINDVSAPGLDPDAYVVGNGGEAAVRVNVPISLGSFLVSPFALGGAGWTRYDVINESFNTSFIHGVDNVLMVPVGAGVAVGLAGFLLDGRFTYRAAFDDDLLGANDLHNWTVSANIGREF